ncbi:MAG: hypothetical protein WKG07_11225 [Hymenobacter sp.]
MGFRGPKRGASCCCCWRRWPPPTLPALLRPTDPQYLPAADQRQLDAWGQDLTARLDSDRADRDRAYAARYPDRRAGAGRPLPRRGAGALGPIRPQCPHGRGLGGAGACRTSWPAASSTTGKRRAASGPKAR